MYPRPRFEGFSAWWTLFGSGMARSNLGQTLVNPGQTWSTLVKLGQNSPNSGKCIPGHVSRVSGIVGPSRVRNGTVNSWSNLVNPGQSSPKFGKCIPDHVLRISRYIGLKSGQKWLGQPSVKLGQPWSNLVNPSQIWSNFGKCALDPVLRLFAWRALVGSGRLGSELSRFACRHPRKSRG
jgi:hypothetical protein